MEYRNVHTGEIENWELELGSHHVMVADDGRRHAFFGIGKTPAFDTCWKPIDKAAPQPDDGCGTGGVVVP